MTRCLLLVLVLATAAVASERFPLKVSLLDLAIGPTTGGSSGPFLIVPLSLLEVAVGASLGSRFSAAVGTSVLAGNLLSDVAFLPVRGYLFYDLSKPRPWRRSAAFVSVVFMHSAMDGWSGAQIGSYMKLSCGASYTFYAMTPHVELGYDWYRRFATLTAGVAVGGLY